MQKTEKIFWGLVALSAFSLLTGGPLLPGSRAAARATPSQAVEQQGAPVGSCNMGGGGGCGCGGGALQP